MVGDFGGGHLHESPQNSRLAKSRGWTLTQHTTIHHTKNATFPANMCTLTADQTDIHSHMRTQNTSTNYWAYLKQSTIARNMWTNKLADHYQYCNQSYLIWGNRGNSMRGRPGINLWTEVSSNGSNVHQINDEFGGINPVRAVASCCLSHSCTRVINTHSYTTNTCITVELHLYSYWRMLCICIMVDCKWFIAKYSCMNQ